MVTPKNNNLEKVFSFLHMIGKLKTTYRFKENKYCPGDSSADHSWRVALMVFVVAEELKLDIDIFRSIKIALVHDLAESITGDIDARLVYKKVYTAEQKREMETEAMKKLQKMLPKDAGKEIIELWEEYDLCETKEARFVKALDKMEALMHLMELGFGNYEDDELAGIYGNKEVKNFPELKDFFKIIKRELRFEFERGNFPWKEEYEDY